MDILKKITAKSLSLNRKRTISTIIGIMLSVALICAVATMVKSFRTTMIHEAEINTGKWHYRLISFEDTERRERVLHSRNVDEIYNDYIMGTAKLDNTLNNDKNRLAVHSMNKNTFNNQHMKIIKGRFPKNDGEILISNHIIYNGGVNMKIGDTLQLEYCTDYRMAENIDDEEYKNILENPDISDEYKEIIQKKIDPEKVKQLDNHSFKIVGIMERPNNYFEGIDDSAYSLVTTGMEKSIKPEQTIDYVILKDPSKADEYRKNVLKMDKTQFYDRTALVTSNDSLLEYSVMDFSKKEMEVIYLLGAFVIVLIMMASIFCIRNSFAISTTEKMKQYGFLASVGATKKQIKKSVLYEATRLGALGITLGILLGLGADRVVIAIINHILKGTSVMDEHAVLYATSPLSILVAILTGIITIWLSAVSSANRAAKVSPVESLKSVNDVKLDSKSIKSPKWVSRCFGEGGKISWKNIKRSKKKYRTTVISIVVSIVIFICMSSLIDNLFLANNVYNPQPTDYNISIEGEENLLSDQLADKILKMDRCTSEIREYLIVSENEEGENSLGNLEIKGHLSDDYLEDLNRMDINITTENYMSVIAYNDESFKKFAQTNNLDYNKVKNGAILYDQNMIYMEDEDVNSIVRVYDFKVGDNIKGKLMKQPAEFPVSGLAKKAPYGLENYWDGGGILVINKDSFTNYKYSMTTLYLEASNPDNLEKEIRQNEFFKKNEGGFAINNISQRERDNRAVSLIIQILAFGFIGVITLVGLTNIFNTITANIELRQNEFAILRSIGMTKKEFNRMINLETLFYSVKALIIGIVLGLLGNEFIISALEHSIKTQEHYIPVKSILISIAGVLILIFIIMHYAVKKVNSKNIMETIRKEMV